jgi:hypothetical protein
MIRLASILDGLLYGFKPGDRKATLVVVFALLLGVAFLASYISVHQAAKVYLQSRTTPQFLI